MRSSALWVILLLALGACAPAASTQAATPTPPEHVATPTTIPTHGPASYSRSMLVSRWDPQRRTYRLSPVDPATGEAIPGYEPLALGVNFYHRFSPDERKLAIVAYPYELPSGVILHMLDLQTWKDQSLPLEVTGWNNALAFSPDGSRLAVTCSYRDSSLLIYDLTQGKITAQIQPDYDITELRFTADGTGLMAYGHQLVERFTENEHTAGAARVGLYDAANLTLRWSAEATGVRDGIYPTAKGDASAIHQPGNGEYVMPGIVWAPDADQLYIVHADEERLTRIDFAQLVVTTLDLQPQLSWFERFLILGAVPVHAKMASGSSLQAVIAPEGGLIYVAGVRNEVKTLANGDWELETFPLNLRTIRSSDAAVVFEKQAFASDLRIAPDGKRLFLQGSIDGTVDGGPGTRVYDASTHEFTGEYEEIYLEPAQLLDGSRVLVASTSLPDAGEITRMTLYSYDGAEKLGEWDSPTYAAWILNR